MRAGTGKGRIGRARWVLIACTALAVLAACTPGTATDPRRLEPPENPQVSLVYGYLDMTDAPSGLAWVEMLQELPRSDRPFYQMRVAKGLFYMEKFPPGEYRLNGFGGKTWLRGPITYRQPRTSPAIRLVIPTPGIYYLGAFKYRPGTAAGKFRLDKTPVPLEAEVLARLLPHARNTPWETRLEARLKSLPKPRIETRQPGS